ncbi:MAG TPA: hypothetical protein VFO60_09065, partial [Candidatus Dormibacteraeota bacterium]|nr:hypothetical protein [Candidatus Dormibacteraeota bacterium]
GKIAYEEKRLEHGRPTWDLIVVDAPATGHVLPQLGAARAMLELARGGIIRSQVEWIDATLTDPRRTALTICSLPEEMAVQEAVELHDRAGTQTRIAIGACFLNRVFPVALTARQLRPLEAAAAADRREAARERLGADPAVLLDGLRVAARLHDASVVSARRLRAALACPVVEVPVQAGARPGLSTTRLVAGAIAAAAA